MQVALSCVRKKMEERREARCKWEFSERLTWSFACGDPAVACLFLSSKSNASQLLLLIWFIHNKALHTGWYLDSLLAGVTRDLSVKGWDQNGFSAFHSINSRSNLRYVTTLWRISIWCDTSWLEQNDLQSKIVKLKLWPLACLHIGKYVGKPWAFRDPGFLLFSQYAV